MSFRIEIENFVSNRRLFHNGDVFFQMERLSEFCGIFHPFYKSHLVTEPRWPRIEIPNQFLCAGDVDRLIRISVFDATGGLIGFVDTSVRAFCSKESFDLAGEMGEPIGQLKVHLLGKLERPRFCDYRLKGVQIAPMLAIDFSSTQVSFLRTNKVQHLENGILTYGNLINQVLDNLGNVCLRQEITGYGFADFAEKSLMPLSMKAASNQMKSGKALMNAYVKFRDSVSYPNSASLAPVFAKAREMARGKWELDHTITLVVVLTNGKFCDLELAINELVEAENEPVIVVMALIEGTRRDVEAAFHPEMNRLRHSDGRTTDRTMATLINYEKNCLCADQSLETRLVPSISRMAREWVERSGYCPFQGTEDMLTL
jgi:hypothetical protein